MTRWAVEVFSSIPVRPEPDIPVEFGTPNVTVSDDGALSAPSVNLIYDPVGLRIEQDHAWMYVMREDGSNRNFRWMEHLSSVELDWAGQLRLRGMEVRPDGALVSSLWVAEPHVLTQAEDEANREFLREQGIEDVG